MNKFESATIILPAVTETYLLTQTADIIFATCKHEDLREIIIVLCDRSEPDCRQAAEKLAQRDGDVPIWIYNQKRPFVGAAFDEAFQLAKGSHVVLMASDLETDPNVVADFISESKKYPDAVVTCSRWKKGGGFVGYNKVKYVCNFIFNRCLSVLFLTRLTDMTYGFRLFPTALVQAIDWREQKHPFYLETALKPLRLGVKFREVAGKCVNRSEGASQNSFFQTFRYFEPVFKVRFMKKKAILRPGAKYISEKEAVKNG